MLRGLRDDSLGVVRYRPEHIAEQLDKIDGGMESCRQVLELVRAEFIPCRAVEPTPLWGAVTAHDAALEYAARVRGGFDGLIRMAAQNFDRIGAEYRPPSELLTYWDLILHIARRTRDPFPPLVDGGISAALCREATLAANARAAASHHPSPPPEPDPFAPLRALVVSYRLKGNEKDTVLAICDGSGSVPLGDLALRFEWQHPAIDWNALRGRLNKKFKKTDCHFHTHDNAARVQRRKGTERK